MRIFGTLIIAFLLIGTGCKFRVDTDSANPRVVSEGRSYDNAEEQERFKQGLSAAGIPYKLTKRNNREFVSWEPKYNLAVEKVEFSRFLPSGRSISLDEQRQSRFKVWLKQTKIPYKTLLIGKREYIIWDQADSKRVQEWEELHSSQDGTLVSPGH
jgi:hypothetical protein